MFINFSNHASDKWGQEQAVAARTLGTEIIDVSFPQVDPTASEEELDHLASEYIGRIQDIAGDRPMVVHIMGEMGFVASFISQAPANWDLVHSTTERKVVENTDGSKTVQFQFVQFRKYRR